MIVVALIIGSFVAGFFLGGGYSKVSPFVGPLVSKLMFWKK